jgi:dTDP-4-dehydrorhamnose reductase
MKIAIFGVSGQLGRDVASALAAHRVQGVEHADADLRHVDEITQAIDTIAPDWVVNCAAMTHVDGCESDPLAAFEANAIGPRNLARAQGARGGRLLQVSTDYVFAGDKKSAYLETDLPRPINAYGISKFAGECFARYECAGTVVVRSSGLYGTHPCRGKGSNFVETMLRLAARGGPLRVVEDERLTPTLTADLAQQIRAIIEADAPAGVYHATNAGECSWYQFTVELMKLAGIQVEVQPIRASEWKSPSRRPLNSVLENHALQALGMDAMPAWRDALARYLATRTAPETGGR